MALTFASLDELRAYRDEREKLFEQAVLMHDTGELTDEEFAMVERKHLKRMKRLAKAEAELIAISTMPEVAEELKDEDSTAPEDGLELQVEALNNDSLPELPGISMEEAMGETENDLPLAEPVSEPIAEPVLPVEPLAETPAGPLGDLLGGVDTAAPKPVAEPFAPAAEPLAEPVAPVLEPVAPLAEPVAPAVEPAGIWGEVAPAAVVEEPVAPAPVAPVVFENPLTAAPMVSSDSVPLPGEEPPATAAPLEASPWDSLRPAAVTEEPAPTAPETPLASDLPPIGLPEPTEAPATEAPPPPGDGASPFAGMFSAPTPAAAPKPHDLQPSARDLEILSAGRAAPAEVSQPRVDEVQDFDDDDFDLDEYEQLKELYGREIFVKEQLQKRLKTETEAKQELSKQILDLTRAKDYANMAATTAKTTAKKMKRIAILLLVVSFCLLGLLGVMYYHDLKNADALRQKAQGVSGQLKDANDKLASLQKQLDGLNEEKRKTAKTLNDIREKLSEAQREQGRLARKLKQAQESDAKDVRSYDAISLKYALMQKEKSDAGDEALMEELAKDLGRDKEDVRGLLQDYSAAPKGHLAVGITSVLQGEEANKSRGTLEQAIDQEKAILRDTLVLCAYLAEENKERTAALKHLETALALFPRDIRVRLQLAEAQVKAGAMDEAVKHYQVLVNKLPARPEVALRLGHLLERGSKTAEASAVYSKALTHHPQNRLLLTALAGIEVSQARFASAVDLLEKALNTEGQESGLGNVHFNLAFAYFGLGKSVKAMEHCTRAKDLGANVGELEALLKAQ